VPAPGNVAAGRRSRLRLTGSLAQQAGLLSLQGRRPAWALVVRWLDSAAAEEGSARFAVCFMLIVSCSPGKKSAIYNCLVCDCTGNIAVRNRGQAGQGGGGNAPATPAVQAEANQQ